MKEIYAQCDEYLLLQCYGFHSESNDMAVEDIKAIHRQTKPPPAVAEAPEPYDSIHLAPDPPTSSL